jgi:NADH:ubiquinone reductase (H+-translocating)
MEQTKVAIIGGGYAGVSAAKTLHKAFKKKDNVQITVYNEKPFHTLMTQLQEVAGGRVEPDEVLVSFDKIFGGRNIDVVVDKIWSVDMEKKRMFAKSARYDYDYLIVASGGEPEFFNVAGAEEHAFTLWSLEDALAIRRQVRDMFIRASQESDKDERKKLLTFVVVGAGFTGVEVAGEVAEWADHMCHEYQIDRSEVSMMILEMMDHILPTMPDRLKEKARRYMEKRLGIDVRLNNAVQEVKPESVQVKDGAEIPTRTVIWTAGTAGSEFAGNLDVTLGACSKPECDPDELIYPCDDPDCPYAEDGYVPGRRGRVLVKDTMESVDYEDVYFVGDNAYYMFPDNRLMPQLVESAEQSAETAAHNIIAQLKGKEKEPFKPKYHGHLISIGSRWGIARGMGMSLSGIFAMAAKHLIEARYLFQIAGFSGLWDYIKAEFLDRNDTRSIFAGHFAAKIRNYWVLPLRVFLGVKWLLEGTKKISDGWLAPGNVYIIATEANTAATPGAEEWAESTAEAAQPLIEEPLGIYNWIVDTFISHVPMLFQYVVVLGEVAIGLAILSGTFTFLAAAGSILFSIMFIISAMASGEILWYIFAAIVVMGGAGRGFGLDHYLMPWLKNWWNGTKLAKRTYLYFGQPR